MTIHEIYDQEIKPLPIEERLRLARLILNDAAPDTALTSSEAMERYSQLIDDAYASGPATPLTKQDFEDIRRTLRARSAQRLGTPDA